MISTIFIMSGIKKKPDILELKKKYLKKKIVKKETIKTDSQEIHSFEVSEMYLNVLIKNRRQDREFQRGL